jgi:predicted nuclease with TOPRIM domain
MSFIYFDDDGHCPTGKYDPRQTKVSFDDWLKEMRSLRTRLEECERERDRLLVTNGEIAYEFCRQYDGLQDDYKLLESENATLKDNAETLMVEKDIYKRRLEKAEQTIEAAREYVSTFAFNRVAIKVLKILGEK